MKRFVVDASVVAKWSLPGNEEAYREQALSLLKAFRNNEIEFIQPPHWLAEIAAVLSRLAPDIAHETFSLLDAMNIPINAAPDIYCHGMELAIKLDHHLFDTLYHAVALQTSDTTLITADQRYFRKAKQLGDITPLADFTHT